MALVLTTDTALLVHSSDPALQAHDYEGWIPSTMVMSMPGVQATVIEVRPLSGIEFARLTTVKDLADQIETILPLCVVSVDGDQQAAKQAVKWPWHLVSDLHAAIVTLSTGGELPLAPSPAQTGQE